MPLVLIVGLPVMAVFTYSQVYRTETGPVQTARTVAHLDPIIPAATQRAPGVAPVAELTEKLAARLEAHPDDPSGWLLLARSYEHIQEYGKARAAYARAAEHGATDAELGQRLSPADERGES